MLDTADGGVLLRRRVDGRRDARDAPREGRGRRRDRNTPPSRARWSARASLARASIVAGDSAPSQLSAPLVLSDARAFVVRNAVGALANMAVLDDDSPNVSWTGDSGMFDRHR